MSDARVDWWLAGRPAEHPCGWHRAMPDPLYSPLFVETFPVKVTDIRPGEKSVAFEIDDLFLMMADNVQANLIYNSLVAAGVAMAPAIDGEMTPDEVIRLIRGATSWSIEGRRRCTIRVESPL